MACEDHGRLMTMVEQLDKKLGNGWANEVKLTLNAVQKDIGEMKTDIALLKERPRNKALVYKDIVLFITSAAAIIGIVSQVYGG